MSDIYQDLRKGLSTCVQCCLDADVFKRNNIRRKSNSAAARKLNSCVISMI